MLAFCCLSQLMIALDVSVVNIALPAIGADLAFSATGLQWVLNAYTIVLAGFLLLGGRAVDVWPARTVLTVGFAVFAGSSLLAGLAPDAGTLVAARALQGLGDAIVAPATLAVLTSAFSGPRERARALGAWAAASSCGAALGLVTGGLLTQFAGWQWVFLVNVPAGLLALVAARRVLPGEARRVRALDVPGAVTASAGLMALVYGTVHHDFRVLGVGSVLLLGFVLVEHRSAAPVLPLRVFRDGRLVLANLVVLLLGCTMVSTWYFVTLQLQRVLGYGPAEAGFAFVPMAVTLVLCSRLAGRFVRVGPVLVLGLLLTGAGAALFALVTPGASYVPHVLVPMVTTAAGIGVAFVAATGAATTGAEAGLAAGLVNTTRQVGAALGLAVLTVVATGGGYRAALFGDAIAAGAGALVALGLSSERRSRLPRAVNWHRRGF